jgi:hypothetical protein
MMATYLHYRWVDETVAHQTPEYEKLFQANLLMGVLDANMNGKIEKAELKGGNTGPVPMLKKYFDMIDANHDGALDASEMAAATKLMSAGRGKQAAAPAPASPPLAPSSPTAGGR